MCPRPFDAVSLHVLKKKSRALLILLLASQSTSLVTDDKVKELRDFMYRGFFKGTTLNFSSYTKLDADTMYVTLKLARNIIISLRCKS